MSDSNEATGEVNKDSSTTPSEKRPKFDRSLQRAWKDLVESKPDHSEYSPGETRYALIKDWYVRWESFVNGTILAPPDKIFQTSICFPLILTGANIYMVTKEEWDQFVEWFGGGPSIPIEIDQNKQPMFPLEAELRKVREEYKKANPDEDKHKSNISPGTPAYTPTQGTSSSIGRTANSSSTVSGARSTMSTTGEYSYGRSSTWNYMEDSEADSQDFRAAQDGEKVGPYGKVGLSNLGNTCFMNSILQCVSANADLRQYILSGKYRDHINVDNPIGCKGEMARAFSALTRAMWSGKTKVVSPRFFKKTLGTFATQFSGFNQQDSQEFLSFLLDRLHEDLNKVKQKQMVEPVEGAGKKDAEAATEAWAGYLKRNDSFIVDNFMGQWKSTVQCPDCKHISITFDPFLFMSISIPEAPTELTTKGELHLPDQHHALQFNYTFESSGSPFKVLYEKISEEFSIPVEHLIACDIYQGKIWAVWQPGVTLRQALNNCTIIVYDRRLNELPKLQPEDDKATELDATDPTDDDSNATPTSKPPVNDEVEKRLDDVWFTAFVGIKDQLYTHGPKINPVNVMIRGNSTVLDLYETVDIALTRRVNSEANEPPGKRPKKDEEGDDMDTEEDAPTPTSQEDSAAHSDDDNTNEDKTKADTGTTQNKEGGETTPTKKYNFKLSFGSYIGNNTSYQAPLDSGTFPVDGDLTSWDNKLRTNLKRLLIRKGCSNINGVLVFNSYVPILYVGEFPVTAPPKPLINSIKQVKQDQNLSIDQCIVENAKPEQLDEMNTWYCPKCKDHKRATKQLEVWKAPDNFIVHMKRFKYDEFIRDKISDTVSYPVTNWDISSHLLCQDGEDHIYDLYAISVHHGSLGFGHYIAYAQHDNHWYCFNDSSVSAADEATVASHSDAYVLFYRRRGTKAIGLDDECTSQANYNSSCTTSITTSSSSPPSGLPASDGEEQEQNGDEQGGNAGECGDGSAGEDDTQETAAD